MTAAFLDMQKFGVNIETPKGSASILRDLDLKLALGERLGLVGESGSGKSMTALSIMGLLPDAARTAGKLLFDGTNLLEQSDRQLCKIRGRRIAMIFQEPMSALNPVKPIGDQIAEGPRLHLAQGASEALALAKDLLIKVGLSPKQVPPSAFPHQLSGGQRQRVMIAIALACKPDLLIADEPTTALDVTVQTGILDLITRLADEAGMALIMISHDLGVIARTTSRMAVMYAGHIVEEGPTDYLLARMAHPYTNGLLAALPQHMTTSREPAKNRPRLPTIKGLVPDTIEQIAGCAFSERCSRADGECRNQAPSIAPLIPGHLVACHHPITRDSSGELIH